MIYLYPANRIENLALLFDKVIQQPGTRFFGDDVVLVQSKGMQHWLNLVLARERGISMNLHFSLPGHFFWRVLQRILGEADVPEEAPYAREVMAWRLYDLLAGDSITQHPLCAEATQYWQPAADPELYRFQLAMQLADLYEQYLIYRPDWIVQWDVAPPEDWQAVVWRELTQQYPQHPVRLMRKAQQLLDSGEIEHLPEKICLFGINALPPLWLDFLAALGSRQECQVHIFHLNPCVEYWGDLQSTKQQISDQLNRWTGPVDHEEVLNPLLANLGSQGREFVQLLQDKEYIDFPVFEPSHLPQGLNDSQSISALQRVQNDILQLQDATLQPSSCIDESLSFVSAHSALREIQGLHDWLLHQFELDATLTPKDVLVMCPQVEDYAPYVDAVFSRGGSQDGCAAVSLPCSIADRTLKNAEPLVDMFSELLSLPESRFKVTQIVGFLRLPALQRRFGFVQDDLCRIQQWLEKATVHWGIDASHKNAVAGTESLGDSFSWSHGLRRLMLGFAQSDSETVYQHQLLVPDVEGNDGILLGRLAQLVDQLTYYAENLNRPRSAIAWKTYLDDLRDSLFSMTSSDDSGAQILIDAIEDFSEYALTAGLDCDIPLAVLRDFLDARFEQPESGRQFMTGRVTFCSMVPMRSVPFRVIAILGLNDGAFPRQRQPLAFDLMANSPVRPGDRSRRGDDRYMFLEALLSTRDKLYLSYQGRDVKTDRPREPSLVMKELMDYLQRGYGWSFSVDRSDAQLRQLPLQPFSDGNYTGPLRSYDHRWLELGRTIGTRDNRIMLPLPEIQNEPLALESLVRFYENPARAFAQRRLNLFLDRATEVELRDDEPFDSDYLVRYKMQQCWLDAKISGDSPGAVEQRFLLSGSMPDTAIAHDELQDWVEQASLFSDVLLEHGVDDVEQEHAELEIGGIKLTAMLRRSGADLLFYRLADPKGKDDVRLWLHHLFAQCLQPEPVVTRGFFRNQKKSKSLLVEFSDAIESPAVLLERYIDYWRKGLESPQLYLADLAQRQLGGKKFDQSDFDNAWTDSYNNRGYAADPYIRWFWPEMPLWEGALEQQVREIYSPLYAARRQVDLK